MRSYKGFLREPSIRESGRDFGRVLKGTSLRNQWFSKGFAKALLQDSSEGSSEGFSKDPV